MNQILFTKEEKKAPIAINKIVIFFCISIIIFGLILACGNAFAVYKNSQELSSQVKQEDTKPQVEVTREENSVNIVITHDKGIDKIIYHWNDEEEEVILGNNQNNITESIELPIGNNKLTIRVIDINGKETIYEKEYLVESDLKIDLAVVNNNNYLKITATDRSGLQFITYKWNNEEEIKIDANPNDSTIIEKEVEIPKGLNTITVYAVDVLNTTQTKTQEVKGVEPPKISVIQDKSELVITLTDNEGLKQMQYTLNGSQYTVDITQSQEGLTIEKDSNGNVSKAVYRIKMQYFGDYILIVNAYNIYNGTSKFEGICHYNS